MLTDISVPTHANALNPVVDLRRMDVLSVQKHGHRHGLDSKLARVAATADF
jgi:hypothetical protein